jgi:hypothetical protein
MSYIGNSPGVASQRVTTTLVATASQTQFTAQSGYVLGYVDVYLNGAKLVNGSDFEAITGTYITLFAGAVVGDVVELVSYVPRGLTDGYTKAEADAKFLDVGGDTATGTINLGANGLTVGTNQLVASGGFVGIGTASPTTKLTIATPTSQTNAIDLIVANGTSGNNGHIGSFADGTYISTNWYYAGGQLKNVSGNGSSSIIATGSPTDSATYIAFGVGKTTDTSPPERMRITTGGEVLVGTATSQTSAGTTAKFVVYGATPTTAGDINLRLYDSGTSTILQLMRSGSTYNYAGIGGSESAVYTTSTLNLAADGGIIKFSTGSTGSSGERVRIDSTGKVGIGTNSPTTLVSLAGGTATTLGFSIEPSGWNSSKHRLTVPVSGDTSVWSYNYNGSTVDYASYATSSISIGQGLITLATGATGVAPSESLRITSDGYVAIGTTTTSRGRLTVSSADQTFDGWGTINAISSSATANDKGGSIALGGENSQGTTPYVFGKIKGGKESGGTWNGYLAFGTTRSNSAVVEAMRIDSQGNVGIGTTTPNSAYKVTIASASNTARIFQYQTTVQADISSYVVGGIDLADVPRDGVASSPAAYMRFINRNTNSSFATQIRGLDIAFGTVDGNSGQGVSASERMRITSAGSVGIGTQTPAHTLQVEGGVRALSSANTIGGLVVADSNGVASKFARITSNGSDISFGQNIVTYPGAWTKVDTAQPSGGWVIGTDGSAAYYQSNSSSTSPLQANRLHISTAGGIGIGTSTPDSALHVVGSLFTNNATSIGVRAGMYAGTYAAIDMVSAGGQSGWIDFHDTAGSDYSERIRGGIGALQFFSNGASTPQVQLQSNGVLYTKNPIVAGSGMTGENGYAISAPFSISLPISTYYAGGPYYNYAARVCKFNTANNADTRFVATIYSRGDYNYSYMVAELHIDIAKWSSSPGAYDFWAREMTGMTDVKLAMDSSGYLWYYFPQLWSQDHVMVVHRMQGDVDLSINNTTYHDSTLPWKTITAGTQTNGENSWGS